MSRTVERPSRPNPRLWVFVAGPLSVFLGLLLALVAFLVSAFLALGNPREVGSGFCSPSGEIGSYKTGIPGQEVVYVEDWGGFLPRDRCSAYLVDPVADANPPLSADEALRRDRSPHLLAQDSFPGNVAYAWIVGLLVLPTAIWAIVATGSGLKRRRAWRSQH